MREAGFSSGPRSRSAERPRICLIGTGGTLAMSSDTTGRRPLEGDDHVRRIRDNVPQIEQLADVTELEFDNRDSSTMRPQDWTDLALSIDVLLRAPAVPYQAIVITHGTDTMAYTASALALAFGRGLAVPIVLTGSQIPLARGWGDAQPNVTNAFRVACAAVERRVHQVMICFGNHVFLGCRAQKRSEEDPEAFHSPRQPTLVDIREEIVFKTSELPQQASATARSRSATAAYLRPGFKDGVVHIRLTPGLDARWLREMLLSKRCSGVILEAYGAGNIPYVKDADKRKGRFDRFLVDDPHNFIPLIRDLVKNDVPVVIASSYVGGSTRLSTYESGEAAMHFGAIPAWDMTAETAAVKFMWLLELNAKLNGRAKIDAIREGMERNEVGEVTPVR